MSQEGFDILKKDCVNSGLCVECGACAAVCPTNAITMKRYPWGYNPEIDGRCSDQECRLCNTVCPAAEIPVSKIEERFFGRRANKVESEKRVGVIRGVFTGYTCKEDIRGVAVSGGITTSILIHALENGEIDGAVLASFDPEKPWIGKAMVAKTKDEILQCAGSCYQPHPQLLGIKEAIEMGLNKIAVTATPCNAIAVRKMMMLPEFAAIGSKIKLIISNFCAAHWSRFGTEWLLKEKMGVKLEDVAKLKYRARPFPGVFKVWLKDGSIREDKFVFGLLNNMGRFTPEDCRVCLDKLAYAADIAVGDTWDHPTMHPGRIHFNCTEEDFQRDPILAEARHGISLIAVRSEKGETLLNSAVKTGMIKIYPEETTPGLDILAAIQKGKRDNNWQAVEARKRRGLPVRNYIMD